MNKTSNKWLTLGVLAAILILIAVLMATTKSSLPTTNTAANLEAELTLLSPSSSIIEVGDLQNIRWTSENYAPSTVSVNIIRKVNTDSDQPAQYEFVRTVSLATNNDGEAIWVPAKSDVGSDTFIEIGCVASSQACRASTPSLALAVIDTGRFTNTANAFEAIERLSN